MHSARKKNLITGGLLILGLCAGAIWFTSHSNLPSSRQTETPQPSAQEKANEERLAKLACVEVMPLSQRIGQKLMAAGRSAQLIDERPVFEKYQIGGIIMMDEVPSNQIVEFRQNMSTPITIAVDQEGGTVQRYKSAGTLPSAVHIASTETVDAAYQRYLADSKYLHSQGVTTNFAPVVDVISRIPSSLPERMYSSDPNIVTDYAAAAIKAMREAGVTPVIKHFPGLGSGSANTDFAIATTDPLSVLKSRDLVPYEKLAQLRPDVMIGNMIVPDLTDGQPAVWSPRAVELLRDMGYRDSVVYSDSLTAEAIPGHLADAVIKAWQAGIDIALIAQEEQDTANLDNYFQTINDQAASAFASGVLHPDKINESVLRILNRKQDDPCDRET